MGDKPSAENDTRENGDGGSGSERTDDQSLDEGTEEETKVESDGAVQRSSHGTVQSDTVGASGPTDSRGSADETGGYVAYDAGPDSQSLADRYGIEVGRRDVQKLQRLENEFGQGRVQRWAEEGMPVETMGKPRDMKAFRQQEEASSDDSVQPTPEEDSPEVSTGREANQESEQVAATEPETERETAGTEVNRSTEEAELGTGREETTGTDAETSAGEADTAGPEDSADESVAVGGSDDSPPDEEGEDGTISVGRRVLQSDDSNEPTAEVGDKSDADGPQSRDSSRTDSELPRREALRSVEALYSNGPLQAKLEVSSPDDPAEREAERVADEVVKMDTPEADTTKRGEESAEEGRTRDDNDLGLIRTVPVSRMGSTSVSGDSEAAVQQGVQGDGKPLPAQTRSEFEAKMGADFSDVSVHTDSTADEGARSINAEAYTMGSDIAFAEGSYQPTSESGRKLLAHELTHVVQQSSGARTQQAQRFFWGDDEESEEASDGGDGTESAAEQLRANYSEEEIKEMARSGDWPDEVASAISPDEMDWLGFVVDLADMGSTAALEIAPLAYGIAAGKAICGVIAGAFSGAISYVTFFITAGIEWADALQARASWAMAQSTAYATTYLANLRDPPGPHSRMQEESSAWNDGIEKVLTEIENADENNAKVLGELYAIHQSGNNQRALNAIYKEIVDNTLQDKVLGLFSVGGVLWEIAINTELLWPGPAENMNTDIVEKYGLEE
jgi:hypothetical protein